MKQRKSPRALVIDDDCMMREALRYILEDIDIEVVAEAGNGTQALKAMQQLHPELVFLDILMPDSNGLEVLKQIHADHPEAKVIMISAESTMGNVQTAIDAGATGFIAKPFNADTIYQGINWAINPADNHTPENKHPP